MKCKPSKADRKEDRIQQLERELSETKKKLSSSSKTIRLDEEQVETFLDDLTKRIEWSTNRIVDEAQTPPIIDDSKEQDTFSIIIKSVLAVLFVGFGVFVIATLIENWGTFWTGDSQHLASLCTLFVGLVCLAVGIDVFREKNRNYLVSLFSALVALVTLIVSLSR